MSWIKRWIDDVCERIANDTGYSCDEVMEAAASVDFDMRLVDYLAHNNNLYLVIGGEKNRRSSVKMEEVNHDKR